MCYFSIIIPVYKVEKYLNQCVDSILCQDFNDYELILVDDGSPDKCPKICDEYKDKNVNVKVIHKSNGGSSSARNAGIHVATGKYIIFVDGDDYWKDKDALSELKKRCDLSHPDYLGFNCCNFNESNGSFIYENSGIDGDKLCKMTSDEVLKYFTEIAYFPATAWICTISREFILSNDIFFVEGIKSEDIDWLINVFTHAEKYDFIDIYFYVYRLNRDGSITNSIDKKAIEDMLYIVDKWCKILNLGEYSQIAKYLYDYLAYHYLCTLIMVNYLDKENKKEMKKYIEKYKFLSKKGIRNKVKIAGLCYRIFGFNIGAKLLFYYHNRNK